MCLLWMVGWLVDWMAGWLAGRLPFGVQSVVQVDGKRGGGGGGAGREWAFNSLHIFERILAVVM